MSPAGLEPAVPANKRPQTHALYCATSGIFLARYLCLMKEDMNGECGGEKQSFSYKKWVARSKIWWMCLDVYFPTALVVLRHSWSLLHRVSTCHIWRWQYRLSWLRSLAGFFFLPPLPPSVRCLLFVCWWEFRKVAFLPFRRWTHSVNGARYTPCRLVTA
jgi:hypothetical protein